MARIRSVGSQPERRVGQVLTALGHHFRSHAKDLPGTPDFVLPEVRTVIRVHGCFWHRHGCRMSSAPSSNGEFWKLKLDSNVVRDEVALLGLVTQRWRVITVWECALRGANRWADADFRVILSSWLAFDFLNGEIGGRS